MRSARRLGELDHPAEKLAIAAIGNLEVGLFTREETRHENHAAFIFADPLAFARKVDTTAVDELFGKCGFHVKRPSFLSEPP
jgi:hypothetical protein